MAARYSTMAPSQSPFFESTRPKLLWASASFAWRRMAVLYSAMGTSKAPLSLSAMPRLGGIVFSPFGAISFLPFPTTFQGHWQLRFVEINRKTQVAEKQVLFPLVLQRLTFYDKIRKKEEHPWTESSLRHQLSLSISVCNNLESCQ